MLQVPRPIIVSGRDSVVVLVSGLTVPCGLNMTLDPFFDRFDIFWRVFKVLAHLIDLAARDEAVLGWFAWLGLDGPAAVLNTS